jgi:predicted TIM-barrel fold metal-dependent hydrolase
LTTIAPRATALIDFRIRPPMRDTAGDPEVELPAELARYDELYGMRELVNIPFEVLAADMERHGVRGVLQAEYEAGDASAWNDRVGELVRRRPDLFIGGIATADPTLPGAVEELERAHDELGLRGWVFQPAFLGVAATDPRCDPLYAYCRERGVPVTIHTGVNFSSAGPIALGRPLLIDDVACRFPGLTIICNHGGWPWVTEAIAVAWKHPGVHLELGAIAPRYLAHPAGGWHPLPHWMDTQLRGKVLLASDWPMMRYDRLLEELPELALRPESERAYVHDAAAAIAARVWG